MTKYLIPIFCGLMCVAGCKPDDGSAGTAGALTWVLSKDGTFTISGKGEMPDFHYIGEGNVDTPWMDNNTFITSVVIKDGVTSIGDYAFYKCFNLLAIAIPNSVTSIGSNAFTFCSGLTSITIPNSVTSIGNYAFKQCSRLTSTTIPNSITSISRGLFYECSGLTSVTIQNSVTSIEGISFAYCTSLVEIINYQDIPPFYIGPNPSFFNVPIDCILYVPAGSVEMYRTADEWKYFKNIMEIQ